MPFSENTPLRIMICAGEVSGDMHATTLMRALRAHLRVPVIFRGFGGDAMRAEGAELLYHTDRTAIIGLTPVLRNIFFLLRMRRRMQREIINWRPDLLLTIDYPGMNLRLANFAHAHGIKTIHYICPQVWAWHRGRIPKIAKMLDLLLCFFPFEPALFKSTSLRAVFIGHPLVDRAAETHAEAPITLPWQGRYRIALLPGSRTGEIHHILPRLLKAAALLEKQLANDCSFIIPAPTAKMRILGETLVAQARVKPQHLTFVDNQARQVMLQAHAAAVASGTATLEASLMLCPTLLVYAASRITYLIARRLITGIRHLGLVNILAQKEVMPELLQDAFTPEKVAKQLLLYLTDTATRDQTLAQLDATNKLLGNGNASEQAAQTIVAFLYNKLTATTEA